MFFEASLNGSEWYQFDMTPLNGGTAVSQVTAPGIWRANVAGLGLVRARLGGTVTGAVTVLGIGTWAGT